ncbi:MAG: Crp/Fnr family transcriptional regulator [Deltaproteobacteria bacterium]|nr:Crp/Fnr family transcriptional regulator [Candidatus Anaeroferrophillacea bacterium]
MTPCGLDDLDCVYRSVPVFRFMDDADWAVYRAYLEPNRYIAGTVIYREGDAGDFLCYIANGELEAQKRTEFLGKPVVIARFLPGSVVGEMAFIDDRPRSVTLSAMLDTEVLVFTRAAYRRLLETAPRVGANLLNGIAHLLSLRLRRANERLAELF